VLLLLPRSCSGLLIHVPPQRSPSSSHLAQGGHVLDEDDLQLERLEELNRWACPRPACAGSLSLARRRRGPATATLPCNLTLAFFTTLLLASTVTTSDLEAGATTGRLLKGETRREAPRMTAEEAMMLVESWRGRAACQRSQTESWGLSNPGERQRHRSARHMRGQGRGTHHPFALHL
jgi:hypothetical protein